MSEPLLAISGLCAGYNRIEALHGVDLEVSVGDLACVIGPNGAGKTTLAKTIAGLLTPTAGVIRFLGRDITRMRANQRALSGLALVPEGRLVFPGLTVVENLRMGCFGAGINRKASRERMDEVFKLFPRLFERSSSRGGMLSGGEQQMLSIGRALMRQPTLIILDEPSLGLSPLLVSVVANAIQAIRERGITVLVIEQNASMVLQIADRGYVLELGRVIAQGDSADLRQAEKLQQAYFGEA